MMARFHKQVHAIDGTETMVPFTAEEVAAHDAKAAAAADYVANHKYKDDRREAYGDIGAELDMLYWDKVNDTTTFQDHVAAVKAAHPKPD
jgi:hypothetical protein